MIEEQGASFEEIIKTVAGGKGQIAYDSGDPDAAPIACGQIAGLIDSIKSVKEVIEDIISEAEMLLERLNGLRIN
jgi:NAD(P)H-dependent flavin oxidoreductase YrpB (nitropropane dioxygenase family)